MYLLSLFLSLSYSLYVISTRSVLPYTSTQLCITLFYCASPWLSASHLSLLSCFTCFPIASLSFHASTPPAPPPSLTPKCFPSLVLPALPTRIHTCLSWFPLTFCTYTNVTPPLFLPHSLIPLLPFLPSTVAFPCPALLISLLTSSRFALPYSAARPSSALSYLAEMELKSCCFYCSACHLPPSPAPSSQSSSLITSYTQFSLPPLSTCRSLVPHYPSLLLLR